MFNHCEALNGLSDVISEIGINNQVLGKIEYGLNEKLINILASLGWNYDEIKDVLVVVLNASEESRIGIFGSMANGKFGAASPDKGKLATEQSDIDILIETNETFPEKALITEHLGKFSNRIINTFMFKGQGAQFILGDNYNNVIWIYENPEEMDKAIYSFVYGM